MNNLKVLLAVSILFFNCTQGQIKNNNYNHNLSKLVFSDYKLRSKLIATFELNKESVKVFKVLISRRNQVVRISIFQIIKKEELKELPSSYFIFKTNTFLCYDGSEVTSNIRLDKDFVDRLKNRLESNAINDTRVLQFDLDSEKKIEIHAPAINPYDLIETAPKHFQ